METNSNSSPCIVTSRHLRRVCHHLSSMKNSHLVPPGLNCHELDKKTTLEAEASSPHVYIATELQLCSTNSSPVVISLAHYNHSHTRSFQVIKEYSFALSRSDRKLVFLLPALTADPIQINGALHSHQKNLIMMSPYFQRIHNEIWKSAIRQRRENSEWWHT